MQRNLAKYRPTWTRNQRRLL